MELSEQIKEHSVVDYDFMFANGAKFSIVLDTDAGDTLEDVGTRYVINTVAKPDFLNPDGKTDPEMIEIFKGNLAVMATRNRKQRQPTEEEVFNMRKTIHGLAKGIQ